MNVQSPVSIVAARAANYVKRHSGLFVQDGPGSLSPAESEARKRAIEQCAERMAASKTYEQFEACKNQMHRLESFLLNADVSQVAHASLMGD